MNGELIPFGKYKGQPIEVLKSDNQYLTWLQTQDWFISRYQTINTLIVNNFAEPSETPEHNRIQTMFLDESFTDKMVNYMLDNNLFKRNYKVKIDKPKTYSGLKIPSLKDLSDIENEPVLVKIEDDEYHVIDYVYKRRAVAFEQKAIDVSLNYNDAMFYIEIKPNLGDDYPAVLRQMQSNRSNVLVFEKYTGRGATLRQVKDIFFMSRIRVLMLSDFNN